VKVAIDQAIAAVPRDKRGRAAVGLSVTGAEAEVGWKPTSWLDLGGYAKKLWRGGWTAGAKAQVIW
jgi:hypothetical protein